MKGFLVYQPSTSAANNWQFVFGVILLVVILFFDNSVTDGIE